MKLAFGFRTLAIIVIIATNLILFNISNEKALLYLQEDGIFENCQAICYFLSALILFYLFYKSKSEFNQYILKRKRNYFYLLLGIFFFLCFGEEISWGQRILNIKSPEYFLNNNQQKEVNIHNLKFWDTIEYNGNPAKGFIHYFSYAALYTYFWFILFVLLPILNRISTKMQNKMRQFNIPIIPITTGLLFLINYIIFQIVDSLKKIDPNISGETQEFNFAVLFLTASLTFYTMYRFSPKKITK